MRLFPRFLRPALIALIVTLAPRLVAAQTGPLRAVFVGNQGNFSDANGSVTVYTPGAAVDSLTEMSDLNSLVQSVYIHDGTGYILANTSDRIDLFTTDDQNRFAQITDVPGPRFMAFVADARAYVSNLNANTVTVIDTATRAVTGTIPVGSNPETIAVVGDRAYVANSGYGADSTLTVIDTTTDAVLDTLDTGCDGPRFLIVDAEDELWVFCNGNTVYNDDFTEIIEQTNGEVVVLDGASGTEVARIPLSGQMGASSFGQDAFYSDGAGEIYAVKDDSLLAFDTATNTPLATIPVPGDTPIGGVAYDAGAERFYLARIPGFTETGFVTVHDRDGAEVNRFDAGIAPASIALLFTGETVAVAGPDELPERTRLHQNYPNPFNPTTTFAFEIPRAAHVRLTVYTLLGETVAVPVRTALPAGAHEVRWDAGGLASGVYLYRLEAGAEVRTQTLTLIK